MCTWICIGRRGCPSHYVPFYSSFHFSYLLLFLIIFLIIVGNCSPFYFVYSCTGNYRELTILEMHGDHSRRHSKLPYICSRDKLDCQFLLTFKQFNVPNILHLTRRCLCYTKYRYPTNGPVSQWSRVDVFPPPAFRCYSLFPLCQE